MYLFIRTDKDRKSGEVHDDPDDEFIVLFDPKDPSEQTAEQYIFFVVLHLLIFQRRTRYW